MPTRIGKIFLCLALLIALPLAAQEKKNDPPPPLELEAGDVAPDFTLLHYDGSGVKPVKLSEFRGKKNVIVAFFVFAFTGG